MPHIVLEYNQEVKLKTPLDDFFRQCHKFLASALPADVASCQSRAIRHDVCFVGTGEKTAFLHLNVKVKAGRKKEVLDAVAQELLKLVCNELVDQSGSGAHQFSVELGELSEFYYKSSN